MNDRPADHPARPLSGASARPIHSPGVSQVELALVWAGGVLFVASLVYSAFVFIITWSNPGTADAEWSAVPVNTALFTLFAAHHSIFARSAAKAALASIVPDRLIRSVYVWLASALLIIVLIAWQPIGGEAYRITGWLRWVLLGVQLAGVWFIAKSVGAIDGLELAGIRQVSDERTNTLQFGGPYRVVRHPLYFGWMLIVFGAAHMTGDRLAFAVITTAYLVLAMPWEERSLQRTFGEEYARYKQQVKWRIVPFLY